MSVRISVITPLYNAEAYIERCINSVLAQGNDNFELILVDDGSTDGSRAICQRYADNYRNVRYYWKENGGPSAARNYGVLQSTGEFLTFLDADDEIAPVFLEASMSLIEQTGADLVCGDLQQTASSMELPDYTLEEIEKRSEILSSSEMMSRALRNDSLFSQCCKMAKRSVWGEKPFKTGILYEDAEAVYRLIAQSTRIVHISVPLYRYYQNSGSTTNKATGLEKQCLDLLRVADEICSYVSKAYPDIAQDALGYKLNAYAGYCLRAKICEKGKAGINCEEQLRFLRANCLSVALTGRMAFRNRIKILLVAASPTLAATIYRCKARCLR